MEFFGQPYFAFISSIQPGSRLRLAPTPSGFLHAGNALNFILQWLAARQQPGAQLYLRIDDLDADRKRPEYETDIFETLEWLGLDWDAPPDLTPPAAIRQSENIDRYRSVLLQLRQTGLLFACKKSRKDLEPFGGLYPQAFRDQNLSLDEPDVAWRIQTPDGFPLPDFVVRRRDGIPAYQLASYADELHFGITHIVRGADLEDSTAAQRYLSSILSGTEFQKINFLHHPLLQDPSGAKLSKSAGASSLKSMRDKGQSPVAIFELLGQWLDIKGSSLAALLESLKEKMS